MGRILYRHSQFGFVLADSSSDFRHAIRSKDRNKQFNRNSGFEDWVKVTMVFNDSYIDSGYYGIETELLSDTALLIRFDEAFSDSHSEIILNHTDSTLITDYENYPLPGGGNTRHGYYKKN